MRVAAACWSNRRMRPFQLGKRPIAKGARSERTTGILKYGPCN